MPKLMPSLRHTKSEEHLDSTITASPQSVTKAGDIDGTAAHATTNVVLLNTAGANVKINIEKAATATHLQVGSLSVEPTITHREWNEHGMTEDDVWSQEDDEITAQYLKLHKMCERDAVSQMSLDSIDSREQSKLPSILFFYLLYNFDCLIGAPRSFNIGDVRTRHSNNLYSENTKPFSNDPEDPSAAALKVIYLYLTIRSGSIILILNI